MIAILVCYYHIVIQYYNTNIVYTGIILVYVVRGKEVARMGGEVFRFCRGSYYTY